MIKSRIKKINKSDNGLLTHIQKKKSQLSEMVYQEIEFE